MKKLLYGMSDYIRRSDIVLILLAVASSALSVLLLVALSNTGYVDTGEGIPYRTALVQLAGSGGGLALSLLLSKVDYHTIAKFWKVHLPLCILVVLLTFVFGLSVGDADDTAWLSLFGGMTLQPTEILKVSFIVTFAYHLSYVREEINDVRNVLLLGLHAGSLILLVHFQGDDGTALIFALIFLSMMFVAGWSWKYLLCGAAAVTLAAPVIWLRFMNNDQRSRILALYKPGADTKILFQQNRGLVAIGSGQVLGTGLFSGEHSYVPAMRNDFIFSFIGNAMGFVGCVTVILLLAGICMRVLWTSHLATDDLGRYICVGVFAMIAFQSLLNIGMNLSLLPVIGVTLPFFSAGGTSVLALYLGLGAVLSVYMHSRRTLFLDW